MRMLRCWVIKRVSEANGPKGDVTIGGGFCHDLLFHMAQGFLLQKCKITR